ncbi:hypothetical protein [Alteromonas profundi]|uniref:hypothetical protein n=1 Tax=Alteromonas profundi TaxID=2696062 RepID=UPI00194523A9|nr:hypothetical protein [Alteromonas profundi]
MSKDYRYHPEPWDSVEENQSKRAGGKRQANVKAKQKRDELRREKQRRLQSEYI